MPASSPAGASSSLDSTVPRGEVIDRGHLDRLGRARDLLAAKGYDTSSTILVGYGAAGFSRGLSELVNRERVQLVDLDQLYAGG